ncbi:hypothetical protein FRC12_008025 [Ceratobasidium sp. 428]|nr:hypothetical protein FRC12_008025 [Ceratobasidium sp. 428]
MGIRNDELLTLMGFDKEHGDEADKENNEEGEKDKIPANSKGPKSEIYVINFSPVY